MEFGILRPMSKYVKNLISEEVSKRLIGVQDDHHFVSAQQFFGSDFPGLGRCGRGRSRGLVHGLAILKGLRPPIGF